MQSFHFTKQAFTAAVELEANNSKMLWQKSVFKLSLPYYQILRMLTLGIGMKSSYAHTIERGEA